MEPTCVRHSLIPGTSQLFGDFLYQFERVSSFFPYYFGDPGAFKDAAARVDYPDSRRSALVSALRELNGSSAALDTLAQPGTLAVVTGQQVGLFSGPAYTIFKALTAARLARQLTENGIRAVPVFWLATEDHDLAEVDHAWMFDQDAVPHKVALSSTANSGPVGEVACQSWPIHELRHSLGGLPFANEVAREVAHAYRPGATIGSGFRSLLRQILRDLDLIYIDPLSPAIREIAAPFLSGVVDRVPQLIGSLFERNKQLTAAGYHTQVHIEADTSLLFVIDGKRAPVRFKDGQFATKERTYNASQLSALGKSLSPNALLRPVMQDYLLPTAAYVGGPAEIAYMAQAQVLYEDLLKRMPVIVPRNSMTLLDARATKILDRYEFKVTDLFGFYEHVRTRMAASLIPSGLADEFATLRSNVELGLWRLERDLNRFDPTLEAAAKKSAAKALYQIDKLARKTANETMRRDHRAAQDAAYVLNFVYPERHLQERFYSIIPFLAKSGLDLPKRLLGEIQLTCPDHVVRGM